MSRWIDADAVIARIAGQMSYEIEAETGNETDCVDLAEELLNDIPSIDIVRCRECKWRKADNSCDLNCRIEYLDGTETDMWFYVKPDDFCSYGKVSEKPTGSEKPNNWKDFFREPTAEEIKAVADYIDSISVPTGVNVFDLMDEQQTSCKTCRYGEVDEGYVRCAYYSKADCKDEPQTDCAWK